jgi:hypothetical protein
MQMEENAALQTLPLILHYVVSNYEALSLLGDCSFVKAEKN